VLSVMMGVEEQYVSGSTRSQKHGMKVMSLRVLLYGAGVSESVYIDTTLIIILCLMVFC